MHREPGVNFDLYDSYKNELVYVDGMAAASVGPAVSRIEFFNVVGVLENSPDNTPNVEVREKSVTITLPTPALFDMLQSLVVGAKANDVVLTQAYHRQAEVFDDRLKAIASINVVK